MNATGSPAATGRTSSDTEWASRDRSQQTVRRTSTVYTDLAVRGPSTHSPGHCKVARNALQIHNFRNSDDLRSFSKPPVTVG